jgi:hypothetical protein
VRKESSIDREVESLNISIAQLRNQRQDSAGASEDYYAMIPAVSEEGFYATIPGESVSAHALQHESNA